MLERFDYTTYGRLLEKLSKGRVNLCFRDFPMMEGLDKYFLLRHDVEVDPVAALRMAKLEADMGYRATYFILFSAQHYNLLAGPHVDFPRRLVELGHEVGLHYDVQVLSDLNNNDLSLALEIHAELLGRLAGQPVRSIAMHLPSVHGKDPFRHYPRYVNAYDTPFTRRATYLSDSAGAWRNEAVQLLEKGSLPDRVTLLTHPHFWDHHAASREDRWEEHQRRLHRFLDHDLRCRKALWASHKGVSEHDSRYQEPTTSQFQVVSASSSLRLNVQ